MDEDLCFSENTEPSLQFDAEGPAKLPLAFSNLVPSQKAPVGPYAAFAYLETPETGNGVTESEAGKGEPP